MNVHLNLLSPMRKSYFNNILHIVIIFLVYDLITCKLRQFCKVNIFVLCIFQFK